MLCDAAISVPKINFFMLQGPIKMENGEDKGGLKRKKMICVRKSVDFWHTRGEGRVLWQGGVGGSQTRKWVGVS